MVLLRSIPVPLDKNNLNERPSKASDSVSGVVVWYILGRFHLSELSGQTIPVVLRISLLIKTIQPDQSNPK